MQKRSAHYNRNSGLKTNYYVDGNTVRRLEGEPEERRQRQLQKEQDQIRRRHRRAAKRNQERAMSMNLGTVFFCAMAVLLISGVCVAYIKLQSDIVKAENDAAKKRIDLSTDLDAVKEQALALGMKYASPGQIFYYSIEDSDFMDQYSEIPEK